MASGEELALLNGESVRTTIDTQPGPCAIVLSVVGTDVALPIFNTTPLGRSAFYLPGVATLSLGLVDVSVDLQTALNGSVAPRNAAAANLRPSNLTWPAWGSARIVVEAVDAEGSALDTELVTSFHYAMSIGLTVYVLNFPMYHVDLARIGVFPGSASLVTPLSVDLRPPALTLLAPTDVTPDGATFRWTGAVAEDADRLELWLSDPDHVVTYPIQDTATESLRVPLRPATSYESWIVVVDGAGQSAASEIVAFDTPSGPADGSPQVGPSSISTLPWATVAVAAVVAVVVVASLRARKSS